jgi:DNA-binding YbaB/EbfC family protein
MKINMQDVLQQAQKVQEEMERVKEEINRKHVTADSGGGMVTATMTGGNELVSIKISKEAVDPDDIEMLEDLIVAAINKATKSAQDMAAEEMNSVTGMMPNIPGMNLGF